MKVITVTGGVATGKSSAVKLLTKELGAQGVMLFDADAEVHKLLTNPLIIAKLGEEFGDAILNPDGNVNRSELREIVFGDINCRLKLEGILHPEIAKSADQALADAASLDQPPAFFLLEIPLLYEVKFPTERDLDLVIAASQKTQSKRLSEDRKLDAKIISALLDSQLPVSEKIEKADVVVWNDGLEEELSKQISLLSKMLIENNQSSL